MSKKTFKKIMELINFVEKNYPQKIAEVRYELNGHGYKRAEQQKEFKAKIVKRQKGDYISIDYYFSNPSGISQGSEASQWVRDARIELE